MGMDKRIDKLIKRSSVGGLSRIHQTRVIQEAAKVFAEIAAVEWDRNEGSAENAILRAAGLED